MSDLERLAGSVLCVGFPGCVPEASVTSALAALRPGGVVLFGRNVTSPEATQRLVAAVREAAGDAYVAVDQEGGRVARLQERAAGLPSMMALGACADAALAERAGAALAHDLRRFGCDLDFAPVCDLASDPRSTVIGTRAFGDDAQRVGALAAAVVRGLRAGGAGATLKHFPGHGATALDSHSALPIVDVPLAGLHARELATFAAALEAKPAAVMSAHVIARALDPERPATLSPRILRDVLRGELGFEGACFSDSLEMAAIANGIGCVAGAVAALAAGCDALVVSHSLDLAAHVRDALVAAVESGALEYARLKEAAARVKRMRAELNALRRAAEANDAATKPHGAALDGDRALALEIARRAVTVVRGEPRLRGDVPVTVVSFEATTEDGIAGARSEFASLSLALRRRGARSELLRVPLQPAEGEVELLLDTLAMQAPRQILVVARRAALHDDQARAVDALAARFADARLVVAAEPFDVTRFPQYASVVCTYGDAESAFEGLADVLCGRATASGRLPVALASSGTLAGNA